MGMILGMAALSALVIVVLISLKGRLERLNRQDSAYAGDGSAAWMTGAGSSGDTSCTAGSSDAGCGDGGGGGGGG